MEIQTSGGEIIGILKKIKDAVPADSHHAPVWKERQRSRMEGQIVDVEVISRIDEGRLGEHLHAALPVRPEQLPAGALQHVSWLATRESVVLVPYPIGFAPWSVLFGRGEPCDNCQDTAHVVVFCFSCAMICHKSTGRATLAMRWTA